MNCVIRDYSNSKGYNEEGYNNLVSNFLASKHHENYMYGLLTMDEAENSFVFDLIEEDRIEEERIIKALTELLKS